MENKINAIIMLRRFIHWAFQSYIKEAFNAGAIAVHYDWHKKEFCSGQDCDCKNPGYETFDEWQNHLNQIL